MIDIQRTRTHIWHFHHCRAVCRTIRSAQAKSTKTENFQMTINISAWVDSRDRTLVKAESTYSLIRRQTHRIKKHLCVIKGDTAHQIWIDWNLVCMPKCKWCNGVCFSTTYWVDSLLPSEFTESIFIHNIFSVNFLFTKNVKWQKCHSCRYA